MLVRSFQEFHGLLFFCAQVLPWIRPLLAPGYAWLAAVGKNSAVKTPELVAMVCIFIRRKFMSGRRIWGPIGGGLPHRCQMWGRSGCPWRLADGGLKPSEAPWFPLEIFPEQAPWLFKAERKEAACASTSAELLASLGFEIVWNWEVGGTWPEVSFVEMWWRHRQPCYGAVSASARNFLWCWSSWIIWRIVKRLASDANETGGLVMRTWRRTTSQTKSTTNLIWARDNKFLGRTWSSRWWTCFSKRRWKEMEPNSKSLSGDEKVMATRFLYEIKHQFSRCCYASV